MKEQTKPYRGAAYDDVFRTLLVDCRQLIIPVVNEVFQENYSGEEEVVFSQNEHFLNQQDGRQEKRITDTSFTIVGVERRKYLMECQSRPDSSMLIRIFEYVTQIALDEGELDKERLKVTFPRSAVIFLRSNRNTSDRMEIQISTPGQETLYEVRVMRLSDYTLEMIFQKNLLFLLPFYIFTHEKHFVEYEKDAGKMETLREEYKYITQRLDELVEQGKINTIVCRTLMEMSIKVVENIAIKYERVWKGVKEIMGGKILEYETKTILREGRSQGACQNLIHNVDNVMKNLGWSLDEACRVVGSSSEEYQSAKEILARE
ncbi:MAG: hypothetical protein LUC98_13890 [Lachnospiraceae bacterium]|nr:hypothetical protein [Lachnospiraceae bacterium]